MQSIRCRGKPLEAVPLSPGIGCSCWRCTPEDQSEQHREDGHGEERAEPTLPFYGLLLRPSFTNLEGAADNIVAAGGGSTT